MIHVHVVLVVDTNLGLGVGIPNNNVGVAARSNDALLWVHAEHARRSRAARFNPTLKRQFASDNTLIDEFHAVFDATDSVRNLGEVAETKFFLIFETERTVIGTHDGEFVHT